MVGIMEKYNPCLDLALPKVKEYKSDLFPLLSPTPHYSCNLHVGMTQIATDIPINNSFDSHPVRGVGKL